MAQNYFSTLDLDLDYQGPSKPLAELLVQTGEGGALGKALPEIILLMECAHPAALGSRLPGNPSPSLSFASSTSTSAPIAQLFQLPSALLLAYSPSALSTLTVPLAMYLVKHFPQCTWWAGTPIPSSTETGQLMYKSFRVATTAVSTTAPGNMSSSLTMDGLPAAIATEIEMAHGAGMTLIQESPLPLTLQSLALSSSSMSPSHLYT
ncbi:MAG: hypothetical protein DHS80DRAFT_24568 [Piptocephalis tieghemiana]|nr:MAG: hypothetical protein DHS80DRAFT_24568 [Piptocephalis tieghemiana]